MGFEDPPKPAPWCPPGSYPMGPESSFCSVTPQQESVSDIPANIGQVQGRVLVWDHGPFFGRPAQHAAFSFTPAFKQQFAESKLNLEFNFGTTYLKPIYNYHDMFVATVNPNLSESEQFRNPTNPSKLDYINPLIDLVGSVVCPRGHIAAPRLPGGKDYESDGALEYTGFGSSLVSGLGLGLYRTSVGKTIFPHQLWIHVGSLLRQGVLKHPSEYAKPDAEVTSGGRWALSVAEIRSSPKWSYASRTNWGLKTYWPVQKTKHSSSLYPVHWTLEKFQPTFQGEDFFVTIETGGKETDDIEDPYLSDDPPIQREVVDTGWEQYKYLLYKCNVKPSVTPSSDGNSDYWVDGISNEAYYIRPESVEPTDVSDDPYAPKPVSPEDMARQLYWWKYKNYILIEIGANHYEHNYFIELVKGRNPRFIHLGEEWDNPHRLEEKAELRKEDYRWMKKSRVLSQFPGCTTDDLLKQKSFRVSVQNNLGRLVIVFSGFESNPWIIERMDNDNVNPTINGVPMKKQIPCIVPAAPVRIHGGNISCAINFSPIMYVGRERLPWDELQIQSSHLKDEDVYLLLSTTGSSDLYYENPSGATIYGDDRFGKEPIGFDCDAYHISEYVKNRQVPRAVYDIASYRIRQAIPYGKGFYSASFGPDGIPVRDPNTGMFAAHTLQNGLIEDPHRISIINLDSGEGGAPFSKELDPRKFPSSEDISKHIAIWNVGIELQSGSVTMPAVSYRYATMVDGSRRDFELRFDKRVEKPATLQNVVTPVIQQWHYLVFGGANPIKIAKEEGKIKCFDISPLVTRIQDGWTAEDYTSINHEATVTCYIPIGTPLYDEIPIRDSDDDLQESDANTGSEGDGEDETTASLGDYETYDNLEALAQQLLKLHNKSFYVTLSYWWQDGCGERDAPGNKIKRLIPPRDSSLLIQMTGIAYGGEMERSVNKLIYTFKVKDYMTALKHVPIFNSPFFDAVSDVVTIKELGKMAHLDDAIKPEPDDEGIDRRPLGFLQHVLDNRDATLDDIFEWNGERCKVRRYDLKGSYQSIAKPAVRFKNGDSVEQAMKRIAQLSGKCIYFDRWGILRFENIVAQEAAFEEKDVSQYKPIFHFVSTPFMKAVVAIDPDNPDTVIDDFRFDPKKHASHLVYNVVKYARSVEDAVNQIVMYSAGTELTTSTGEKKGGFISEGHTFFDQIFDPTVEGFFGYQKPFYQANGVFGDVEQVRKTMALYAKMKYPIASLSFETYGIPGLKALDLIAFDGNLFYITDISHEVDASQNRWWMNVNAEWLKPFKDDLGFLSESGPQDSGTSNQE